MPLQEENLYDTPPPKLAFLDSVSRILDNRFRIPGTNIRFGLDFLIGLVPYAGDLLSFILSGGLVVAMAKHGASGMVIAKMLGNIVLDTTVGSIPILGDLFDLGYKANRRNFKLLREHYDEEKHQGSVMPYVIGVIVILLLLLVLMIWAIWNIAEFAIELIMGLF